MKKALASLFGVAALVAALAAAGWAQEAGSGAKMEKAGSGPKMESAMPETQPAEAAPEAATASGLTVMESALTTGVEDRQPVDKKTEFPAEVEKVFCWTKIGDVSEPTKVVHRWKKGDEIVAEVPLNVGGSGWRVYSSKIIAPDQTGDWSVEIVDGDQVIKVLPFTIVASVSQPEQQEMQGGETGETGATGAAGAAGALTPTPPKEKK